MEDKNANIKERVLQIADNEGVAKEVFFAKLGMSYGNFKGKSKETPLNSNSIVDILTSYPAISCEWLLMGRGKMLQNDTIETPILQKEEANYNERTQTKSGKINIGNTQLIHQENNFLHRELKMLNRELASCKEMMNRTKALEDKYIELYERKIEDFKKSLTHLEQDLSESKEHIILKDKEIRSLTNVLDNYKIIIDKKISE